MFFPTKENYTEMTPAEFEKYAISVLSEHFEQEGITDYSFEHNVIKKVFDGDYQIDGEIKFQMMGVDFDVLVECKHYKGPIKREQIQALNDKIRSTGAHKGIFITTSYFQSGALKYGKEHGIALIFIIDGKLRYEARSKDGVTNPVIPEWVNVKPYCMAIQTQISDNSTSISYVEDLDGLLEYIVKNEDGEEK